MKFKTEQGFKGKGDKRLLVSIGEYSGYEQITYEDLLTIVKFLYQNEDRIYPPPKYKGARLLSQAFSYVRTHTIIETLKKFQLRGKRLPEKSVPFFRNLLEFCETGHEVKT